MRKDISNKKKMSKQWWGGEFIRLLEAGVGFWIILDDRNDVLRWEIADLIHLKVNVTLNECFFIITV